MDFGVQVNVYRTDWPAIKQYIQTLEAGDWNSIWFADHFIPPGADHPAEALTAFEGLSGIATAAGMTEKLRLGNLVLGLSHTNRFHNDHVIARCFAQQHGFPGLLSNAT